MSERTQRLIALRSRTDHDLVVLVTREIARGLNLLDSATSRQSPLFTQAQRACGTAAALLPRIAGLADGERLRIEATLKELRSRLEQMAASPGGQAFPASFAS